MLRRLGAFAAGVPHTVLRNRGGGFALDGVRRPYHYARYNLTWLNERAVELPLALEVVHRGGRILEVGNVLAHYGELGHEVVDRYERAPGVRNIDVLSLEPGREWDRVVSISTVERVASTTSPATPRAPSTPCACSRAASRPAATCSSPCPSATTPSWIRARGGRGGRPARERAAPHRPRSALGAGPARRVLDEGYDYREKTARACSSCGRD